MEAWRRTYWAVFGANLVTAVGMMSFVPFFPGHLEAMGVTDPAANAAWTGVVFGAAPFTATFMGPVWGALGDRIGRRLMMARALLAITVFVGCMHFATTPLQLLLLRIGQGLFSGFIAPSITLVSVLAPPDRQGRVTGSLQTATALGAVLGPLVGAELGRRFGFSNVFLFVAAAAAFSLAIVLAFAHEDPGTRQAVRPGASPGAVLRGMGRDLARVLRRARLRAAVVMSFCLHLGHGATNPLLLLFVAGLLDGEGGTAGAERLTGALFSLFALANVVAMPLWGAAGDRLGHDRALLRAAGLAAFALALHALAPSVWVLVAARLLQGLAMAGTGPLTFGLAAREIPVERHGGAMGVVFSSRTLAVSVAAMAGGGLARFLGIRGLFAAGAALVLASSLLLRRAARRAEQAEPA